jgi:hypothetical protein
MNLLKKTELSSCCIKLEIREPSFSIMKNSVFSVEIYRVFLIFKNFYLIFNIFYWKILSNSKDSQLQAQNTGYWVKNWNFLNSESSRSWIESLLEDTWHFLYIEIWKTQKVDKSHLSIGTTTHTLYILYHTSCHYLCHWYEKWVFILFLSHCYSHMSLM